MLASVRLATLISLAGMRISERLVTSRYRRNFEVLCMFLSQRNTAAKKPELHRIPTDRGAGVLHFGAFDQAKYHQALHLRIDGIDKMDDALLAALKCRECVAVYFHNCL